MKLEPTVTTLVLLRRDDEVLLAMKKRGFGAGRWNGIGGKIEPGETIKQAMLRESQEEICIIPQSFSKVAEHEFIEFHQGEPHRMQVHVFTCDRWDGEPTESEEMAPRWFDVAEVPYDQMWPDDEHWLPQVLAGKLVRSRFELDEHDVIVNMHVDEVEML